MSIASSVGLRSVGLPVVTPPHSCGGWLACSHPNDESTMNTPKNKTAYRRWLREQFDAIESLVQYGEPDFFTGLEIAELIEQASRLACRFGAGHLIGDE